MASKQEDNFEGLIAKAQSEKFSGWDFSWLKDRLVEETPPWDYRREVAKELPKAKSILDLGTGGGEFLSSLRPLPAQTFATEGYPPNAVIARNRLRPLGVDVIRTYAEDNATTLQAGVLPFRTESLDMVIDRHESFVASEVHRVLKRGGTFLTQQAGSANYPELNEFFGVPKTGAVWDLQAARKQLIGADFFLAEEQESRLEARFRDIGAVVFYLLAVPWQLEGFSVGRYLDKLKEMHRSIVRNGSFNTTCRKFYVKSVKR